AHASTTAITIPRSNHADKLQASLSFGKVKSVIGVLRGSMGAGCSNTQNLGRSRASRANLNEWQRIPAVLPATGASNRTAWTEFDAPVRCNERLHSRSSGL